MPPRAELKRLPRYPKHQPIVSQTRGCPAVGGGGRAWGRDEGSEVGAWSSGGGGGLGRQDTMRPGTVRGRAGMPSTSAIGKLVEAVDVHGVAWRRSPNEQARRHRRVRAWTCAGLDNR